MSTYSTSNYTEQGGDRTVVGGDLDVVSGGEIDIESGGALKVAGVDKTTEVAAAVAAPVAGVAAGYKVARGIQAVTGSSTALVTGLATVVAVVASLEAIGVGAGDAFVVAARKNAAAGKIDLLTYQDDGNAATNAANVHWVAVGT